MKKLLFSIYALFIVCAGYAQDDYLPEEIEEMDSTEVTSLEDIINSQNILKQKTDNDSHYSTIWGRNTFFNISYNTTTLSSKELPSASGEYTGEYNNKLGLGLQWGHTYNFHKKPIGDVLFIGLDYSWLDLNVNLYDQEDKPLSYEIGDSDPYNMPWFNKKWAADYGMSLGPSLTLYPFTSLRKSGTDNIRLQVYYHVGYSLGLTFISDVETPKKTASSSKESTEIAWGHGLFTSFGFNLTWKFVGLGYEARRGSNYQFKNFNSDFDTDATEFKQTTNRIYIQFRF